MVSSFPLPKLCLARTQGLLRLGITHETTLAYSPYQNGKQESFWGVLEGRMMAMLEGMRDLSLEELNRVSQAWVEMEYHRKIHSETSEKPVERFLHGKSVLRTAPDRDVITLSFRKDEQRAQRRSDGTISLLGKRFEIPNAYRNLPKIAVRYAEWDLRQVHLIDVRTQACLSPLYPLDRARNAEGLRRKIGGAETVETQATDHCSGEKGSLPPLLKKLIAEHAASGLPPAYIADPEMNETENEQLSQEKR